MNLFAEPVWLYAGITVALLAAVGLRWTEARRKRRLSQFASPKLLPSLASSRSSLAIFLRHLFLVLALLLLFLALARPQWGSRQRETAPTGIDALIAVDVSRSMLARDVRPNRIERVKSGIAIQLEKVKGDRLGLLAFAGSSFLQCPLTLDHAAFRRTLDETGVGSIKRQGTDLAAVITDANRSFSEDDNDRFLILISDGEDLEGAGLRAAKDVAKRDVRIYTIGVGSKIGARIPLSPIEAPAVEYLTDPAGKQVVTKMDEDSLRAIAEATGGKYYPLGPTGEGLAAVFAELQEIGHKKRHMLLTEELPIERYQLFLAAALLLLAVEFLLGSRRRSADGTLGPTLALFLLLFVPACKKDNVRRAEEAHEKGDYARAASLYQDEIEATKAEKRPVDSRLLLNAGLSLLDADSLSEAETLLEQALDASVDAPDLQSKALNALGNLHYARANQALDVRDVATARKAWEQADQKYAAAAAIDANPMAKTNRDELNRQLRERIEKLIARVAGLVWRDINGDGQPQEDEPLLPSRIYWDANGDGEHNQSSEPSVETDRQGRYAFEWISSYPAQLRLGVELAEGNATQGLLLLPILPPPPPPLNPETSTGLHLALDQAGDHQAHFPHRAAPTLKGYVWNDSDKDGERDDNETGHSQATLFLDLDGDLAHDDNETTFKPDPDGSFSRPVPPGQHVLCIQQPNPDANVTITYPREENKAHLVFVELETTAEHLDFGIHSPPDQNQDQNQSQDPQNNPSPDKPEPNPDQQPQDGRQPEEPEPATASNPQEQDVNALYERLLQEAESKATPLETKGAPGQATKRGRDY